MTQKFLRNGRWMSASEMRRKGLIGGKKQEEVEEIAPELPQEEIDRLKGLGREELIKEYEEKTGGTADGKSGGELVNKIKNFFNLKK